MPRLAPLPIDDALPSLGAALADGPNAVLVAPPGAGKTTRVPGFLVDAQLVPAGAQVIVLEPRRMAARLAARRTAEERGVRLGEEVGYHVRFDKKLSPRTRIAFLTEGLLTARLESDPTLEGVGAVVLDEFHERSIHADLALAFVRELQLVLRPELRIVVMSATLDPGPLARFLGDARIVRSEGRAHPVEVRFASRDDDRYLDVRAADAIRRVLHDPALPGDVLAFLPGAPEIRRTAEALGSSAGQLADIRQLYGDLEPAAQDAAIRPGPRRKVVLATNIAETSLTIEGVRVVVDGGLRKALVHDPARGLDRLETVRISRASAEQRAGRAGRLGPGVALRLYTEAEFRVMPAFDRPEIAAIDLAPVVLSVLAWADRDPAGFGWFEAPPAAGLERALLLLRRLGALPRAGFTLTPLGRRLARLPLHPRLGATLLAAADLGQVEAAARLAALASEKDLLLRGLPERVAESDLLDRLERLEALERSRFDRQAADALGVDLGAARQVARIASELLRATERLEVKKLRSGANVLQALLAGFPDRVCLRREGELDRFVMVGGRGVRLAKGSVVKGADLIVAHDVADGAGKESVVHMASAIRPEWLPGIEEVREVRWAADRRAVAGVIVRRYLDLELGSRRDPDPDPTACAELLAEQVAKDPRAAFRFDGRVDALLARIRFLARAAPELGLPDLEGKGLLPLLLDACAGARSFAELAKVDLADAILAHLGHERRATLDREAPARLRVPSGSEVRVDYPPDGPPVLSVKLQECFGLADTPRVAFGRVGVKMELLAPNQRPVQVTQDLRSFWGSTYAEVKKELRGRYPKHPWPDDPWTAPPTKGTRRRSR